MYSFTRDGETTNWYWSKEEKISRPDNPAGLIIARTKMTVSKTTLSILSAHGSHRFVDHSIDFVFSH